MRQIFEYIFSPEHPKGPRSPVDRSGTLAPGSYSVQEVVPSGWTQRASTFDAGVDGLIVCGSLGEGPMLSHDEKLEVFATARKVAGKSAHVVKIGKQAFYRQLEMPLDEAYRYAAQVMVDNMLHAEAEEGIGAFLEKRNASWPE